MTCRMYSVYVRAGSRVLLGALLLLLAACGGEEDGPEQRIRALIERMQQHVEAGEVLQLKPHLHADYSDPRHHDRRAAISTLFLLLQRHRNVHLFTVIKSVELKPGQDDAADAVVYVAMTGVPVQSLDALVSLKVDLHRFDVGLVEQDGDWQVRSSRWARVDPGVLTGSL